VRKIIIVDVCGDCPKYNQYVIVSGGDWQRQILRCRVQADDPDSPPPEGCPLVDATEYIKATDALAILDRIIDNALYAAPGIYLSFKKAIGELAGGGGGK